MRWHEDGGPRQRAANQFEHHIILKNSTNPHHWNQIEFHCWGKEEGNHCYLQRNCPRLRPNNCSNWAGSISGIRANTSWTFSWYLQHWYLFNRWWVYVKRAWQTNFSEDKTTCLCCWRSFKSRSERNRNCLEKHRQLPILNTLKRLM